LKLGWGRLSEVRTSSLPRLRLYKRIIKRMAGWIRQKGQNAVAGAGGPVVWRCAICGRDLEREVMLSCPILLSACRDVLAARERGVEGVGGFHFAVVFRRAFRIKKRFPRHCPDYGEVEPGRWFPDECPLRLPMLPSSHCWRWLTRGPLRHGPRGGLVFSCCLLAAKKAWQPPPMASTAVAGEVERCACSRG